MARLRIPGYAAKRAFLPDWGNGADGSPASSNFTVGQQVYQWVNYTLDAANTITLSTTYMPSIFRCMGTLTINGTIDGDAKGQAGGAATTATQDIQAIQGDAGYGYGAGRNGAAGGGGGGGACPDWLGDVLKGTISTSSVAGSGGGGGGANNNAGGAGGRGGGGLVIITRRLIVGATAVITLDGAAGSNADHGGGGGSGGPLIVLAEYIELAGAANLITSTGGAAGTPDGSAGGSGRIYLCYLSTISGDLVAACNPDATGVSLHPTVALA